MKIKYYLPKYLGILQSGVTINVDNEITQISKNEWHEIDTKGTSYFVLQNSFYKQQFQVKDKVKIVTNKIFLNLLYLIFFIQMLRLILHIKNVPLTFWEEQINLMISFVTVSYIIYLFVKKKWFEVENC